MARAVGFADTSTVTGADLPDDPAALEEIAAAHAIFARVTPDQKKALVEALADRGRYIAMVGDGVNDVAAMKAARIAIALGSGSQIARGVSDIVLVQDDFRSIPRASSRAGASCSTSAAWRSCSSSSRRSPRR